jgi:hypothetical protein
MAIIAYVLPILPGQTEAAKGFASDLEAAGYRDRYAELNRRAHVTEHGEWVAHLPAGDVLIVAFSTDTPNQVARTFEDNDYDNWWRARVKRIHGFDPATGGGLPERSFSWREGD